MYLEREQTNVSSMRCSFCHRHASVAIPFSARLTQDLPVLAGKEVKIEIISIIVRKVSNEQQNQ
jgi:hypothetical protein